VVSIKGKRLVSSGICKRHDVVVYADCRPEMAGALIGYSIEFCRKNGYEVYRKPHTSEARKPASNSRVKRGAKRPHAKRTS
jgi:hypothetical protein